MNSPTTGQLRQRLLYVVAGDPSVRSQIRTFDLIEPVPGGATVELSPEPDFPYKCVHDALCDGWRIVQFPDLLAPYDDRQVNVQGYPFVLEKLEVYGD